jgi:hypothetical protein
MQNSTAIFMNGSPFFFCLFAFILVYLSPNLKKNVYTMIQEVRIMTSEEKIRLTALSTKGG